MNANTNASAVQPDDEKTIEGQVRVVEVDHAQAVLNPTQYAASLFESFLADVATAKRKAARNQYDIATPSGLAAAKEFRNTFQKIRTSADKLKSERKKPIDQAGKAILTEFQKVADAAKAEEDKHDQAIRAEEARQAAEKQRKLDAERERVEALQRKVDAIRQAPQNLVGKPSDEIKVELDKWLAFRPMPDEYQDHLEEALIAVEATCNQLRQMLDNALQAEADERQRRKDQAELERLRAEQAERERAAAEQQRLADERAAEQQRQLEEAQRAQKRNERIMQDLQRLQQIGMREGDARALTDNLEYLDSIVVDAEHFGDMMSMAQMAKDVGIQSLKAKLQAALDIELPLAWDWAHDEDAQRADLEERNRRISVLQGGTPVVPLGEPINSTGQYYSPTTTRNDGKPILCNADGTRSIFCDVDEGGRPDNSEILDVLATHYGETPATVLGWLRELVKDMQL